MKVGWELREGVGKIGNKEVPVWYVGPSSNPFGYASFTVMSAASDFFKRMNGWNKRLEA
jgi:hypothetical protein